MPSSCRIAEAPTACKPGSSDFLMRRPEELISLKTPAVILENVWCQSRYSDCRMFCPRSIYSWWREVWLERVDDRASGGGGGRIDAHGRTSAAMTNLEPGRRESPRRPKVTIAIPTFNRATWVKGGVLAAGQIYRSGSGR